MTSTDRPSNPDDITTEIAELPEIQPMEDEVEELPVKRLTSVRQVIKKGLRPVILELHHNKLRSSEISDELLEEYGYFVTPHLITRLVNKTAQQVQNGDERALRDTLKVRQASLRKFSFHEEEYYKAVNAGDKWWSRHHQEAMRDWAMILDKMGVKPQPTVAIQQNFVNANDELVARFLQAASDHPEIIDSFAKKESEREMGA